MIITQTPLRLSFLGGNTDFRDYYQKYGGRVLTTAIDKYIYCIVKQRFDDLIRVSWSIKESVEKVDDLQHELVREAMKKVGVSKGIEINFLGDIPSEGSGLGSSSSVLVGTLNALYHYVNEPRNAEQLAREACEIEIDILGKPIGIQDQYIAAYGGFRLIEFNTDETVKVTSVPISDATRDDLDNSLMLYYTGQTRPAGQILAGVKKNLAQKKEILDKNKIMAREGFEVLSKGNIDYIGKLLHQYWILKKSFDDNISNSAIDIMYETAIKAGAIGGKIAGAGGGGFLLLMVPSNRRKKVREALIGYRELPFRMERDGSKVIFNVRRY